MKTLLLPLLAGTFALALLAPAHHASAQSPFTSSRMPNSNPFGGAFSQPSQPAQPVMNPAGGIPPAMPVYPGYGQPSAMSSAPIDPNHKLGRGDVLSYYVVEDREDPSKRVPVVVTDSGDVALPPLGLVHAANKTVQQLTADVKNQLEQKYYWPGHATVVIGLNAEAQRSSAGRVYITGAVRGEGVVDLPVDGPMTVSQAIFKVGGFKDFGDPKHVRVLRKVGPPDGIPCNVANVKKGKLSEDVVLQPGDTIVVREKLFNAF